MKALILAAAALVPFSASVAGNHSSKSIVGAWQLEVTLRNCTTGDPIPGVPPFATMNTFHQGGTLTEFGTRMPPSQRGVGQGVWKRVGRYKYESHFFFFRFDATGAFIGGQDVRRTSELSPDGQWLSTSATVEVTDASGAVIARGCATEDGSRL